jgi:hypothetical protein
MFSSFFAQSIYSSQRTPTALQLPRKPCSIACNEQGQSPFFARLPPEIRNAIYVYAFSSEARTGLCLEPHPLSVLITCQKSYYEASILAFRHTTFPLSASLNLMILQSMRNITTHLSTHQICAITTLSHSLCGDYTDPFTESGAAAIGTNAVLLLPNLMRFELCIPRGKRRAQEMHRHFSNISNHMYFDPRWDVIQSHLPHWFTESFLWPLTQGHSYAWQEGEHWTIEWPQVAYDKYFDMPDNRYLHLTPRMNPEAVGVLRGVHMCPCECGNVEWTSADIVQESGRRVAIDTVYYGPGGIVLPELDHDDALKAIHGCKAVILKEGSPPINVKNGPTYFHRMGMRSFGYEADDDYWETLRRRNGDWGAIWRGVWKVWNAEPSEERFPGSMASKTGDWAPMKQPWVNEMEDFETTVHSDGECGNSGTRNEIKLPVKLVRCHDDEVAQAAMT